MNTKSPKFATAYGPRRRVVLTMLDENGELIPSRTKQAHKDECDVNMILARFEQTGVLEHVQKMPGRYGDFASYPDFQAACDIQRQAQDAFDGLPAKVRDRFQNDPARFISFMADPENTDEAVRLGLAKKRVVEPPATPSTPSPVDPQAQPEGKQAKRARSDQDPT